MPSRPPAGRRRYANLQAAKLLADLRFRPLDRVLKFFKQFHCETQV
jgi:hypothetical protein